MMSLSQWSNRPTLRWGMALLAPLVALGALSAPTFSQGAPNAGTLTVRSDIQEADARTGIVTARGNVQINYPARQIQATSAQAQYFSRERRIVLSGNVFVLQEGNSLRGETITYLMDEGRFIALPQSQGQVESIYLVPAEEETTAQNSIAQPFNPQALPPLTNQQ